MRSPGFFALCLLLIMAVIFLTRAPDAVAPRSGEEAAETRTRETIIGRAIVVDGDTIHVGGQRIRLWGIDAPEGRQSCGAEDGRAYPCGKVAARALAEKLRLHAVRCVPRDRDRYGRIVGQCFVQDEDIGGWLVRQGWALPYPRMARHPYAADRLAAEHGKRGLWQGRFEAPDQWRRVDRHL